MRQITFDCETKNTFQDANSTEAKDLDLSVVCIHDSLTGECSSFFEQDLNKLWPILENADMLISFNGEHFDIPLLNKYYSGDLTKIKHIDLMKEVKKSIGRRIKLDTLAGATLGIKKSGHGLEAIEWWRNGELDKLVKYCIDDVKITRELYDYALKNKHLKYTDNGVVKDMKIDPKDWETAQEKSAMTFTLPF